MTKRKHHILIFLSLHVGLVLAQNPHPYFRNYTTDDGLPSPEVHYCLEDDEGYMWFATDNGVSRFDGYEFKNYGPREGLKDPVVFYLQKDSKGTIWMATMTGPIYYVLEDRVYPFEQNKLIEEKNKNSGLIIDFYIDSLDTKYLSIRNNGILKFNPDQSFDLIINHDKRVHMYGCQIGDRWIMGSFGPPKNIKKKPFELKNGKYPVLEISNDTSRVINLMIDELSARRSESFWMKSFGGTHHFFSYCGSLFELDIYKAKVKRFYNFPVGLNRKALYEMTDGRILLGLAKGKYNGFWLYKNVNDLLKGNYQEFLSGVAISHIYKDSKNGFWFSTIENGLFYCPNIENRIYDQSIGFPTSNVTTFDFKNKNELYIGLIDGTVIHLQENSHTVKTLPSIPRNNIVYDLLYLAKSDELWIGNGYRNYWFKGNEWNKVHFSKIEGQLNPYVPKKMTLSRDHSMIWGGNHLGFGAINVLSKTIQVLSNNFGFTKRSLRVWEDQTNRLWVGNIDGLIEFRNNQLVPPTPFFSEFNTRVEDIGELSDGTLVIGTKGEGVLFWQDSLLQKVNTQNGLSSDMIENVYVDSLQNIWVGTLKGLNKIRRRDTSFLVKVYSIFHGLPSNEINQVKVRGSEVWVATSKGLINWSEPLVENTSKVPSIEKVLVNDQAVKIDTNPIFSHRENDIEFHYTTINFRSQGRINYRYRLNEGRWNTTQNRTVNFANLSPDIYRFEVQSQNEDQIWSASTITNFEIQPPFYQTKWFIFLGILFLAWLAWLWNKNQINKFKKEEAVKLQINELRGAALRAQMNPHFIFNCLNSIQNLIQLDDKENASRYLIHFAKLIRSTLNASANNLISLEEEVYLLENYLALEKLRFKEKFEYQIDIDPTIDQYEIKLPSMSIQTYIENAIQHGFAHQNEGGKIIIQFRKNNGYLEVQIQDNGIGFFQSQRRKNQAKAPHRAMGMNLSQQRLRLLNAANSIHIQELKNKDGTIEGTLVTLKIQLKKR